MHDLKKKSTVLPLLDFLENTINIEYTFRQVATESDFNYYIDHLQQPSYNAYDLIYLCFIWIQGILDSRIRKGFNKSGLNLS